MKDITKIVKIVSPCFQKVNGVRILSSKTFFSDTKITNTGCPQGTVLSPYLFSLYTSDYRDNHEFNTLVKYADDTFLLSLIIDYMDTHFSEATFNFVDWCKNNFLDLNVPKTKEMTIDFRKNSIDPDPIIIENEQVEKVDVFKYLGSFIDNKLNWAENTKQFLSKLNSRLYCLRKLGSFNVNSNILQLFYSATISGVLTSGATVWGNSMTQGDRDKFDRIFRRAGRIVGKEQQTMTELTEKRMTQKLKAILNDETHPLRQEFDNMTIQRTGRLRLPKVKTSRYQKFFIPTAAKIFNSNFKR